MMAEKAEKLFQDPLTEVDLRELLKLVAPFNRCGNCSERHKDHGEDDRCLFAPGVFREMTAAEKLALREAEAESAAVSHIHDVLFPSSKPSM